MRFKSSGMCLFTDNRFSDVFSPLHLKSFLVQWAVPAHASNCATCSSGLETTRIQFALITHWEDDIHHVDGSDFFDHCRAQLPRPLLFIHISSTRHIARVRKQTRYGVTLSVFWWKTGRRCSRFAMLSIRLRELHIPCPQLVGIFVCNWYAAGRPRH